MEVDFKVIPLHIHMLSSLSGRMQWWNSTSLQLQELNSIYISLQIEGLSR